MFQQFREDRAMFGFWFVCVACRGICNSAEPPRRIALRAPILRGWKFAVRVLRRTSPCYSHLGRIGRGLVWGMSPSPVVMDVGAQLRGSIASPPSILVGYNSEYGIYGPCTLTDSILGSIGRDLITISPVIGYVAVYVRGCIAPPPSILLSWIHGSSIF